MTKLLLEGYKANRLSNTFKRFYGKHTDLVGQYKKNFCMILSVQMIFIFDSGMRMIFESMLSTKMQKLLQCTVALVNQTSLQALCFF